MKRRRSHAKISGKLRKKVSHRRVSHRKVSHRKVSRRISGAEIVQRLETISQSLSSLVEILSQRAVAVPSVSTPLPSVPSVPSPTQVLKEEGKIKLKTNFAELMRLIATSPPEKIVRINTPFLQFEGKVGDLNLKDVYDKAHEYFEQFSHHLVEKHKI